MRIRIFLLISLAVVALMNIAGCTTLFNRGRGASSPMTVMSYNIRYNNPGDGINAWPNRKDHVAEMLGRKHRADIAGLQEVLVDQVNELQERMPEYAWVGVGRDDGKTKGEFSPIFYRKDRFERLESGTFWLSETPDVVASKSWDAAITRIVTWGRFRDRNSGRTFYFFNTHFDHMGVQARRESARMLAERLNSLPQGIPFIATGDLNMNESDPGYAVLSKAAGVRDARYASQTGHVGPTASFTDWQKLMGTGNARIDYVFVREGVQVLEHRILEDRYDGRFPSDHLPVLARVALP